MVRGILVTMLYKKASCLSINEADPSNSLTLMSADVERITQGWQTMHEIWANSAEIALAIYLLERQLGISCVVPVCVALVALVGSLIGISFVVSRQAKWLEAIERRISSTSGMLGSIKGVKMLGLQNSFMKFVHGLRLDELNISKKFRTLLVWNMAFGEYSPSMTWILLLTLLSSMVDQNLRSNFHLRSLCCHLGSHTECIQSLYLAVTLFPSVRSALDFGDGSHVILRIGRFVHQDSGVPGQGRPLRHSTDRPSHAIC